MPEAATLLRRHALRQATNAQHRRLDARIGRLSELSGYRRYLATMTAFRASIEPEPVFGLTCGDGPCPLPLVPDMALDCADLGIAVPEAGHRVDIAASRSAHLGMQYVLEGSAMGARVLMGDAQKLGLGPAFGARHLARQIADRSRWSAHLAALERADPFDLDAAVRAATRVFALAIACAEG